MVGKLIQPMISSVDDCVSEEKMVIEKSMRTEKEAGDARFKDQVCKK